MRTRLLTLFGWLVASAAWYWPTRRAGWVTDILGLLPRLTDEAGLAGAWTGYGSPVFHPLTLAAHYVLYAAGGPRSLLYYAVWVGLHGLVAWGIGELLTTLARDHRLAAPRSVGLLASAAFLVHPYVAEAVVWRATLNYLLCAPLLLAAASGGYAYAKTGRPRHLVLVAGATAGALLSFDLAWAAPLLVAAAAAAGADVEGHGSLRAGARRIAAAAGTASATFVTYLAVKAVAIGTAVGHYGADVHLRLDLTVILPNAWRALLKPVFLTRELAFAQKSAYHAVLAEAYVYVPLTVLALGLLVAWWRQLRPRSARWRAAGWIGIATLGAVAPTANLYFYWLQLGEGDRYGYLPTAGLVALLALGWGAIPRRAVRFAIAVAWLGLLGYVGRRQIQAWAQAEYLQRLLVDAWPVRDDASAYVLAAADNYRGAYLFRDGTAPYTGVDYALRYLGGRSPRDSVESLVGYNQVSLVDSVWARVNAFGEVELGFAQFGNWWWRGGIGLTDYSRPEYRVSAGDPVRICFTRPLAPGTALLYPAGRTWSTLDASALATCAEVDAARAAQ